MLQPIKKTTALILLAIIMLAAVPADIHAASVTVTIPTFAVTLNGTKMDNSYSQYPLIVYKDITYFPMTYYDCRFLGLETDWNQAEGLKIYKTGALWEYKPYNTTTKNGSSYKASTAQGAITVNGEVIDNNKETYPLLQFRNVTYFPLTWRFAVDSFGWEYDYSSVKGLVIQAGSTGSDGGTGGATSPAAQAQEVILPIAKLYDQYGGFLKHNGYYYYQGDNGIVYQASLSTPGSNKQVYRFEGASYSGTEYDASTIYTENGRVFLKYHAGGGVMGRDYLIQLKEGGSYEDLTPSKYFQYKEFPGLTVLADASTPSMGGNLSVKQSSDNSFRNIGSNNIYYSLQRETDFLQGDYIYVLAFEGGMSSIPRDDTYLHQVNYKTGASTRVCDTNASLYVMDSSAIYFSGNDYNGLFRINIGGSEAEKLSDASMEHLALLDGTLFYITKYDGFLYKNGSAVSLNPNAVATSITVRDGYLYARFSSGPYKIMVFDKNGNEVAKTIEDIADIYMDNGKAVFVKNQ